MTNARRLHSLKNFYDMKQYVSYSLRSFVVFSSEGKSNFHVCKHLVQFTNFQRTNTQEWLKFCQFDKISIWNCVFAYRHTSLSAIRDRAWYNVNEKQNTCSY